MKELNKLKMKINPSNLELILEADILMKSSTDTDDLYIVMFNIVDNPLRLSIITISNLHDIVKEHFKFNANELTQQMASSGDLLISEALNNLNNITTYGTEKIKIPLNSPSNAKKARIIISSMIENEYYVQNSNYILANETINKTQQIETKEIKQQLKVMLEIIKRWDNFDSESFQKEIENGLIEI